MSYASGARCFLPVATILAAAVGLAQNNPPQPAPQPPPAAAVPAPNGSATLEITAVFKAKWTNDLNPVCISGPNFNSTLGLNHELWVQVAPKQGESAATSGGAARAKGNPCEVAEPPAPTTATNPLDTSKYVLFLNGAEVKGLDNPIYKTYANGRKHALVFKLRRTSDNKSFWNDLLGSPTKSSKRVTVALAERDDKAKTQPPSITGSEDAASFNFQVFSWIRLPLAVLIIAGVIFMLWGHARRNATLRDSYLPQLPAESQTYSLARWQMAFWFTLIFCSYVFLFVLLWDYNTISAQALTLMGISGVTALAAVAIDVAKDSPADQVCRGLRALGLNAYEDVIRVKQEIADRKDTLSVAEKRLDALLKIAARTPEQQAELQQLQQEIPKLQTEILGRQGIIRTYEDKTRPFRSQGWLKDMTTDMNGMAVHRLQVFFWTLALGAIFLIGVYRDLTMPSFSNELLALMAISGGGYVGFKYPEKNN